MLYKLTQNGIDAAVGAYEEFCQEQDVARKEAMMLSMTMDSILTKMSAVYGEDFEFSFSTGKRFGRAFAKILWSGDKYDPLQAKVNIETGSGAGTQSLLFASLYQNLDIGPSYTYRSGINTIQMPFRRKAMNPMLMLLLSIMGGMIFGILTNNLADSTLEIINLVATYINNLIFGVIGMVAAPMIFLSIITGILGVGSISEIGKIGKKTMSKFLYLTLLAAGLELALCWFVFPIIVGDSASTAEAADQLLGSIFTLFPINIVVPFVDGNFAQIIGLAAIFGLALLIMGEKAANVIEVCGTLNYAVAIAMGWVMKLIPAAIFIMFAQYVWQGTLKELVTTWRVFAVCAVVLVLVFLLVLIWTSIKLKIKVGELFKLISTAMIMGLSTGDSTSAFMEMKDVTTKKLHLKKSVVDFAVPLGISIYGPAASLAYIATVMYTADSCGVEVSASWIITLMLLSVVFAFAQPPVAGGSAACIAIIFDTLGMPLEYLAIATSIVILFDYFVTCAKCGELICLCGIIDKQIDETVENAKHHNSK